MSLREKKGALTFFGKGQCVACHAVSGKSNEMFSDFEMHVMGVPQIAPEFGIQKGNVIFDGPGEDEDFGLEQITGVAADHYKSVARRSAMSRCRRPSSTMEPSRDWRTRSITTCTFSNQRGTMIRSVPA